MDSRLRAHHFLLRQVLCLFLMPWLLAGSALVAAEDTLPMPEPADEVLVSHGREVSLADCIHIALEKQPALAAFRASMAASRTRARALEELRTPTCLMRDLPVRRQQSALGVTIATAALRLREHESIYAVQHTYFTAVYARQQLRGINGALDGLKKFHQRAKELADAGRTDITDRDLARMTIYLEVAEARRQEALIGVQRALAALREALGVGPDFCLRPLDQDLPFPPAELCREQVLELALARRQELVMAATAAEIVCLEIKAQSLQKGMRAQTFAAGRDPGAQQVAQGERDGQYKPGGVPLEIPMTLVGDRCSRVEQIQALHARAVAVVDKTRNLVLLETEDVYWKWLEARRKAQRLVKAADDAKKLAEGYREDLLMQVGKITPNDVLTFGAQASQFRADANQALYQHVLALAALERVTAGGFCAGLVPVLAGGPDLATE